MTPTTLLELIDDVARRHGQRPALLGTNGERLDYRDLRSVVGHCVDALVAYGIRPSDTVAVALADGPTTAAVMLGVMCAAACAPLNPASSVPEAEYLLRDLGAAALLVAAGDESRCRVAAARIGLPIAELSCAPGRRGELQFSWSAAVTSASDAARAPASDDVALRLHTSGTTARAKQVPLTHGNLVAATANVVGSLHLTTDDRCLNVMPLFHSHGLLGATFGSLGAGASVVCAPRFDARRFSEWAAHHGATWYTAAPTIHAALVATADPYQGFRLIRSASAPLPPDVGRALEAHFGAPLVEVYGMTEAYQIAANDPSFEGRRLGTVGRPTGTEVGVLDDGVVVRHGAGEVVVRGPNVFAGYASPPGANDDAFVDGWFRTGDLGAIDADGFLRITGRVKELINRAGEKISPREVDEALLAHPDVAAALAFTVTDPLLGEDVGAGIVLRPGASLSVPELRRFLAERLAPFKVPTRVVFLDSLPMGAGGKPQRRVLTEQYGAATAPKVTGASTGTTTYERLARLWTEVLGLASEPDPGTRFFDLGGTSMRVAELVGRIEVDLGCVLPIDDVLAVPTLRTMAAEIDELLEQGSGARRLLGHIRPAPGRPVVVLVPGAHGNAIGLQPIADELGDDLDVYAFSYPGGKPGEAPLTSIDELAARLVDELERAGCATPSVLFGNSLGSWVVYEAARRLAETGAVPPFVVLGDMYSPAMKVARGADRPSLRSRVRNRVRIYKDRLRQRRNRRALPIAEQRHQAVFRASSKAQGSYAPRPFVGKVMLIVSENRASKIQSESYGWSDLVTGSVEVQPAVGGHSELHLDNAALIARCIRAGVARASA